MDPIEIIIYVTIFLASLVLTGILTAAYADEEIEKKSAELAKEIDRLRAEIKANKIHPERDTFDTEAK